ncbi:MAG: DNA repair protein RadC [Pseudomonadota bacterium]
MAADHRHIPGFSEDAQKQLAEMGGRFAPAEAYAAQPSFDAAARKRASASAGSGGGRPSHYGHRERLRQRFLSGGAGALPEYEVLELILFNAIPRVDVKPLAKELLAAFGDLNGVLSAPEAKLARFAPSDEVTRKIKYDQALPKMLVQFQLASDVAARMARAEVIERPVVSSWDALMRYCKTVMAHRETEQFRVLYLDRKNVLVADEAQGEGTVDHVPVYPREVAKRALELNASAIILVHNHPSGDPTPSEADISMTRKIVDACGAIGVTIHDHVVIGKETDASFRELGLL